ncbi:hypothetical protein O181_016079 [Austropuccinia psidii MF-1]|uniref:Uncharacterized protein n=1 Tax=Austropuccinia psidii MF-1 TaxID=1389203 RepID=A0A9Q3GRF8_9BASI|nr:hypothetical protein [Austropuccinia psidii MF-1]
MYCIDICNSKKRHITIGTNKEKKVSLDIYQMSTHDPLEELLNEFREGQFSTSLTSKQKLSLLKMLRKNRPEFTIGEKPLDVKRPYPPMLRRPLYSESLESRKEIEKHINEILEMDFIGKIGHNEIVEITTPVLITWHDGKSRFCGNFRALNNYTKVDRQLKDSESRYGETQIECLCLVWALEKHHYSLHTNADGLRRWPLDNVKRNPAYDPEVEAKIPINFMEMDRRKNFRFSEWATGSGTPYSEDTESEGTETPILGIISSKL